MAPDEIRWKEDTPTYLRLQSRVGHIWGGTGWRLNRYVLGWELTCLDLNNRPYGRKQLADLQEFTKEQAVEFATAAYWIQAR